MVIFHLSNGFEVFQIDTTSINSFLTAKIEMVLAIYLINLGYGHILSEQWFWRFPGLILQN